MTKFGIIDASTGQVRWGVDRTQQMTINNYRDYLLQQAKGQIASPAGKNVEVVLSTQIIDGEPGKPTIELVA